MWKADATAWLVVGFVMAVGVLPASAQDTVHENRIIRIEDSRHYVANLTLDSDSGDATHLNFERFAFLTTSNYQVGVRVSVGSGTGEEATVFLRSYSTYDDRLIATSDNYISLVVNGDNEPLVTGVVTNGTTGYFTFPINADSNGQCQHQGLENNYLAIDVYVPNTVDVVVSALIVVRWEDTRLGPLDPYDPLDRPVPVLEIPHAVVTGLALTSSDSNPCLEEVTITFTFVRPDETYVDSYWLYIVEGEQASGSDLVPVYPAEDATNVVVDKVAKGDIQSPSTGRGTYTFTDRPATTQQFFVLVYTANEAGRDDTPAELEVQDNFEDGFNPDCGKKHNGQEKGEEKDVEDEEEEAVAKEEASAATQKYTVLDSRSVSIAGEAGHSSWFDYSRSIRGFVGDGGLYHLYRVSVSDMAAYNLTITSEYDATNTSASFDTLTGTGLRAVVILPTNTPRCPATMTLENLQLLAEDDDDVQYFPLACSFDEAVASGTTAESYSTKFSTTLSAKADIACSAQGLRVTGALTFNLHNFCTGTGTTNTGTREFDVVIVGREGLVGGYELLFESTDFYTSYEYGVEGDIAVEGSSLANLQDAAVVEALEALLDAAASPYVSNITSITSSGSRTLLSFVVPLESDSSDLAAVSLALSSVSLTTSALDSLIQSATGFAPSSAATFVSVRTHSALHATGCVEKGEERTVSVPYSGCSHPNVELQVTDGNVRGIYLRRDGVPNAVSHDAVASFPDTRVMTQDSCVVDESERDGAWYGQAFLLSSEEGSMERSVFSVSLTLSEQAGYGGDTALGFVCCDQLLLYRYTVPATKRFVVTVDLPADEPDRLEALFVQKGSCPGDELTVCAANANCMSLTSATNGAYSVVAPLSMVEDAVASEWCVGLKAKPSTAGHEVDFALTTEYSATPSPTTTPVPSYNPCSPQELFCQREFVEPDGAGGLVCAWSLAVAVLVAEVLGLAR